MPISIYGDRNEWGLKWGRRRGLATYTRALPMSTEGDGGVVGVKVRRKEGLSYTGALPMSTEGDGGDNELHSLGK